MSLKNRPLVGGAAAAGAFLLSLILKLVFGWTLGVFLLVFFLLIALGSGAYLLHLFRMRKTQREVKLAGDQSGVFNMEELASQAPGEIEKLQAKWKSGVQTLSGSQLKERGDPIYVLPWYALLGRSGGGKSTAVRNCQVPTPFSGLPALDEIAPTQNLDWWFLDSAVILDTTGRYCFPEDGDQTRHEWQALIQLLCATRRNEPLNGVIVAVPVDDLKNRNLETLAEDGKKIRRRINALMNASGMDFPVYLMITKADLLDGFADFFSLVPDKVREQVLGLMNKEAARKAGAPEFFQSGFHGLIERLRRLRLSILMDVKNERTADRVFLFPEELESLQAPLEAVLKTLFAENPYENTPFFRGLFLASARQQGRPLSSFLARYQAEDVLEPQTPRTDSFFLKDFFGQTLQRDRSLSGATRQARDWQSHAWSVGLVGWAALCLLLCVQLTFSFGLNWSIINTAAPEFKAGVPPTQDIEKKINALGNMNKSVTGIYDRNHKSFMPRLGLYQSMDAEKTLRNRYVNEFESQFLKPVDEIIARNIDAALARGTEPAAPAPAPAPEKPQVADFRGKQDRTKPVETPATPPPASTPSPALDRQIQLILDRLLLLKHRLDDPADMDLGDFKPKPDYAFWLSNALPEAREGMALNMGHAYIGYLLWQADESRIKQETRNLTALLARILSDRKVGLNWMIDRVNRMEDVPPVTYGPFWWDNDLGGIENGDIKVEPAFTAKGWREKIEPALKRLQTFAADPEQFRKMREEFERTYWERCQDQWERFLTHIQVGEKLWPRPVNRLEFAPKVLGSGSPYARVLETARDQLQPLFESGHKPRPWADLIRTYGRLQSPPYQTAYMAWLKKSKADAEKPGFFERAQEIAKGAVGGDDKEFQIKEDELEAIKLFVDFDDKLGLLARTLRDKEKCYEAVKAAFEEEKPTSASVSPVLKANWDRERLQELIGKQDPEEKPFWLMFEQPLRFGWKLQLDVTAQILQDHWEKDVLSEVSDLEGWRKMEALLYGKDPKAFVFVRGPAAPFLIKNKEGGYTPTTFMDLGVPFSTAFLDMLEGGKRSKQQLSASDEGEISVYMESMPTDVNPGAKAGVNRTAVQLRCGKDVQLMEHFNFPMEQTFLWKPNECKEVVIEFEAGDAAVEKEYSGFKAFAQFLSDVAGGNATYQVQDMVKTRGDIAKEGITAITIKFKKLRGQEPVLKFLEYTPTEVAQSIIKEEAR
ncbi:MAG: hypothetical protein KKB20_00465 [Proteobacteria bacterium]|nr:hypothetical protein [Pseudomonadota bacterium]